MSSVCSIITTASAPRGMTPPVAIAVAVPGVTSIAGCNAAGDHFGIEREPFRGAPSLAPAVSAARTAKPSTLERSNGGASTGATTSAASTRDSAAASGTVSPPQRRAIDARFEAPARLGGGDHFEELLLPRGALDRVENRRGAFGWIWDLRPSISRQLGVPAAKPSLSAGTTIQPSLRASDSNDK